jgi:hypothetical protein
MTRRCAKTPQEHLGRIDPVLGAIIDVRVIVRRNI